MPKTAPKTPQSQEIDTDYPGSDNHHDLKRQPGEKGDPAHARGDGDVSEDVEKASAESDADTELAAKLKAAVTEDDTDTDGDA